jgi:phosphinothricin acetyltransferase
MTQIQIRPLSADDYPQVRNIYRDGIATGHATFEVEAPAWEGWDDKFVKVCRLVAEGEGVVLGWAGLSAVSDRCVYGGVAEVAVYVAEDARGKGIGTLLLDSLVKASEEAGYWTLQAVWVPSHRHPGTPREDGGPLARRSDSGTAEPDCRGRLARRGSGASLFRIGTAG